jgi:AraC-like DNA-binding protein
MTDDLLSDLLADLRLESTMYCMIEGSAPWGVAYPGDRHAAFHVVTAGECVLEVAGRAPLRLLAGDFVVLPRATPHVLRGAVPARAEAVEALMARPGALEDGVARVGGGGERAAYLCGGFAFGARRDHPLLAALPEVMHVKSEQGARLPWLESHLAAVACETRSRRPGAGLVLARLSDVLFVHAIRAFLAELPDGATGWVGALRDPPLARALGLMHRQPERPWTVESLARQVGMSRSGFAARFAAVVGQPPLSYLAAWRVFRAKSLLRDGSSRLAGIAGQLGYGSEAAFSTAFKRVTGIAPGAYRRAARDRAPIAA